MEIFHFSEQPYPDAWDLGLESLRNNIPNSLCDPQTARQVYLERQDEWLLCDELGINIAFNEHHTSATCLSASPEVTMAIMARITNNVQLLPIGFQVANRPNPVLLAEQIAMADVISGGRLQVGLVKGAPYELSPANSNPGRYLERFWEGVDLITKALSNRDEPINFEGDYYHYRQVNVWPRPFREPHPPIWVPAQSPGSTKEIAQRGYNFAAFLCGRNFKILREIYAEETTKAGFSAPGSEKFGYLALCAVGETEEEGHARAYEIHEYLRTTSIISEAFVNPPGYQSPENNAKWLRLGQLRGRSGSHFGATMKDGTKINQATASIPELIDANIVFAGTADQVYEQICEFNDHVGGIGNYVFMFHGGRMKHDDVKDNLRRFAKDVMPRLKERYPDQSESEAA